MAASRHFPIPGEDDWLPDWQRFSPESRAQILGQFVAPWIASTRLLRIHQLHSPPTIDDRYGGFIDWNNYYPEGTGIYKIMDSDDNNAGITTHMGETVQGTYRHILYSVMRPDAPTSVDVAWVALVYRHNPAVPDSRPMWPERMAIVTGHAYWLYRAVAMGNMTSHAISTPTLWFDTKPPHVTDGEIIADFQQQMHYRLGDIRYIVDEAFRVWQIAYDERRNRAAIWGMAGGAQYTIKDIRDAQMMHAMSMDKRIIPPSTGTRWRAL